MKIKTEEESREHYEKVMGWIGKVMCYLLHSREIFCRDDIIDELKQHKREAPTAEIKRLLDDAIKTIQK
ncbi:hypothetical protein [Providencia alcalifaciens]|uniref:hypothetical protein n=1 Tax=Providencia alcalifaciens TaxID=126385 RepID=UPI00029BB699|nr:hypothetical protein [Providencia alcalifaciens]EKT66898.1 hypothetical protein OO9_03563 [Providencia alcalifaciens Dmel2]